MAEFEVERVGGELKRFGVEGSDVPFSDAPIAGKINAI